MTMAYIIFVQPTVPAPAMAGSFSATKEAKAPYVGVLFLLALFFSPLVAVVSGGIAVDNPLLTIVPDSQAAPATIVLYPATAPALLVMIGIAFCYSIADGLALGLVSYPLITIFRGRRREVHWLTYLLAGIFLLRYLVIPLLAP